MRSRKFLFESEEELSALEELHDIVTPSPRFKDHMSVRFLDDYLRKNLFDSYENDWGASQRIIMNIIRGATSQEVASSNDISLKKIPFDRDFLSKAKKVIPKAYAEVRRYEKGETNEEESRMVISLIDAFRATKDAYRSVKFDCPWDFNNTLAYAFVFTGSENDNVLMIQQGVIEVFSKGQEKLLSPKVIEKFLGEFENVQKDVKKKKQKEEKIYSKDFEVFVKGLYNAFSAKNSIGNPRALEDLRSYMQEKLEISEELLRQLMGLSHRSNSMDIESDSTKSQFLTHYPLACRLFLKNDPQELLEKIRGSIASFIEEREKKQAKAKPEVPEEDVSSAPWGKFAFAVDRLEDVPEEPDTEEERDAFNGINAHVNDNTPIPADTNNSIRNVLKKKSWYKEIIKEPQQEYVYRGMVVSKSWLLAAGIDPEKDEGSSKKSFTYSSRRPGTSSSWSVDAGEAKKFTASAGSFDYSVLMVAKISENEDKFIVGDDGFYKLNSTKSYKFEKEAIALGDVEVMKVYWKKGGYIPLTTKVSGK